MMRKIIQWAEEVIRLIRKRDIKGILVLVTFVGLTGASAILKLGEGPISHFFPLYVGLLTGAVVSGISFVLLLIVIAASGLPIKQVPESMLPKAVIGVAFFTEADAGLLYQLGRNKEIDSLLSNVLHPLHPLTVLRGKSGSGKTSVLAALIYRLKQRNVPENAICHWSAAPDCDVNDCFKRLRMQWGLPLLDEFFGAWGIREKDDFSDILAISGGCHILIIDDFEFLWPNLPEHQPLFSFLKALQAEPASSSLKVVIALREEYAQTTWVNVHQQLRRSVPAVWLECLHRKAAYDALATLLGRSGTNISQATLDRFLSQVSEDSGVLPLLIGIGTVGLEQLGRRISYVRLKDYYEAGGAMGLILLHVQRKLGEVDKEHRPFLLKALRLCLVDPITGLRNTAGASTAEVAGCSELDEERIQLYLRILAADDARILERVGITDRGNEKYRLVHDCYAELLGAFEGGVLENRAKLKWAISEQFERWQRSNRRKRRHLLRGEQLEQLENMKKNDEEPPLGVNHAE